MLLLPFLQTPYLSISCRYIEEKDETCKLVSCMLSCEQLLDFPVTGEMIAEMLKMTMKKFGIEETAVSVTTGEAVCINQSPYYNLAGLPACVFRFSYSMYISSSCCYYCCYCYCIIEIFINSHLRGRRFFRKANSPSRTPIF